MHMTRQESDAWLIMQGDTQERLDGIHVDADIIRANLEAEGRGPSTFLEPFSSDDEEFEILRPMTPPASPPWTPRVATSKENEFVDMEIQQPKLGDNLLQNIRPAPFTSPRLQARKGQRQRRRRSLQQVFRRVTRSKASKITVFYELAHDNKTSHRVSSSAPMNRPNSPGS